MKTRKSYPFAAIAAILALSLAVAFATVACDNGSIGGGSFPSPKGKITVNGLSSFEGKYIMGTGSAKDNTILLVGYTVSNNTTYNLTKITSGKAEIPVYSIEVSGLTSSYKAYAGSDSVYEFGLTIFDSAKMSPMELVYASALDQMDIPKGTKFSNGNMTITWDSEGGGDNPGVGGNAITDVSSIGTYLAAQSGGASASSPINLTVSLQLTEANWDDLLAAIKTAGKYVNLDLSDCTRSTANDGGGFHSDGTFAVSPYYYWYNNDKIVSLIGPNAATSIGSMAFYDCTGLTSVSFPNVTSIGNHAFTYCTSLTSASFPNVTSIGAMAFAGCFSLTSVDIPANTPYGSGAFDDCPWQPTWAYTPGL